MDSSSVRSRKPRFRTAGTFGKRLRPNSGLDTRRDPLHGGKLTRSPGSAEQLERGRTAGGFWACRSRVRFFGSVEWSNRFLLHVFRHVECDEEYE